MRYWAIFLLLHIPSLGNAATIYLCRAYSGGEFWASAHCQKYKALILRIAEVPDGMPFNQQVSLAQRQAQDGRALLQNQAPAANVQAAPSTTSPVNSECSALARQAEHIDKVARNPHTAYMQDALAKEKRDVRTRQALLRCG
jgi:hypothetical protein